MKLLSWNTRGISNLREIKILRKNIKMTNPTIVFLQETKYLANYIQDRRGKIWEWCESMGIDARGYSGGLCILWDPSRVSLTCFQGTRNSIIANFKVVGFPISGIITNIYGAQKVVDKHIFVISLQNPREILPIEH